MALPKTPHEDISSVKASNDTGSNEVVDSAFEEKRAQILAEISNVDPEIKLFATRSVKSEFDGTIEDGKL